MTLLSPRFVVLVCLCAALPLALPSPVQAAHVHGSRSVGKHSSHRAREDPVVNQPTDLHRHDGKDDHKQNRRFSDVPPLLRRYRVPDREEIYKRLVQGPSEDANHNVPKSAFARSRYRRGTIPHGRRSSIYVPGEHGNKYIVSRSPRDGFEDQGDDQSSDTHDRRQLNEDNLALGRVDIMSSDQSPGKMLRLASLMVDATPIDWSSGQGSAKAFPLNASTSNQTQFIMVPTGDVTAGSNKRVTLATQVFDANSAEMVMYCATYDPDPGSTSPLLMTPCTGVAQAAVIDDDDTADPCDAAIAASSDPHLSQIFFYDPSSGRIEPISATTSASNLVSCAEVNVRRDSGNATTSANTSSSTSTSTSVAPAAAASQQAQKVSLVYVAAVPEVPASAPSASVAATPNVTSTARASNGQVAVLTTTTTLTTTVVATVTDGFNRTVSPARAAVTVSVSSKVPLESTTTAVRSGAPSAARSAPSLSSTPPVTPTAPTNANESLEVEIVGIGTPSDTPTSSSTSATTTATSTTNAPASSTSTPLDAEAVASSIANEMPHRRRGGVVEVNASAI